MHPVDPAGVAAAAVLGLDAERCINESRGDDARVWVLDHDDQLVTLKVHQHQDLADVLQEADLLHRLDQAGIPCPAPLRGPSGHRISTMDGTPVGAYRYLSGATATPSDDPSPVAGAVARLHNCTDRWQLPRPWKDQQLIVRAEALIADRWPDGQVRGRAAASLWAASREALARIQSTGLPRSVVHHDPHPGNVLHAPGAGVVLIDYGEACSAPCIVDLAALLVKWREDPRLITQTELTAIRDSYTSVRPLQPSESTLVADAVLVAIASGASDYLLRNRDNPTTEPAASESAVLLAELLIEQDWGDNLAHALS